MYVANFMFWVCVTCINNEIRLVNGLRLFYDPPKGVPWKFWLDPRFPQNLKLKWILKRLPLDRGYFKVYFFTKGESILIIFSHTYLLTRNFVVLFQVMFTLPCILFLLNCPVIRYYWLTILRKEVTWKLWLDPRFPRHPKWKWSLSWLPLDRGHLKPISYGKRLLVK